MADRLLLDRRRFLALGVRRTVPLRPAWTVARFAVTAGERGVQTI